MGNIKDIPRPLPPGAVKDVLTAVYKYGVNHEECVAILQKAVQIETDAHESRSAPQKLREAQAENAKLKRELKQAHITSTICIIGSLICAGILFLNAKGVI